MNNNDYIVLFDENGQPYIEHAFGDNARAAWGKLKGTSTKFLEKIPDYYGKGKSLYLYTKEQVNAFHNRGREAASNAVAQARQTIGRGAQAVAAQGRDVASRATQTANRVAQEAGNAVRNASETISKYGKVTLGSIRKAVDDTTKTARRAATEVGEAVSNAGSNIANTAKNVASRAGEAGRNALNNAQNLADRAGEAAGRAAQNLAEQGRAAASRAGQAAGEVAKAVGRGAQNAGEAIKDAASKAVEGLSDAVDDAAFELSWFADDVIDRYNDLTGKTARERRDKAYDDYLRAIRVYGYMAASGDEYSRNEIQQALDLFNAAQMVYQHR